MHIQFKYIIIQFYYYAVSTTLPTYLLQNQLTLFFFMNSFTLLITYLPNELRNTMLFDDWLHTYLLINLKFANIIRLIGKSADVFVT